MAAALLLAAASNAHAQASDPTADDATVLHLSESAQRLVRQDRLSLELRAEATGTDPARVQSTINRRMAAALDQAHAVSGVEAETRGYWVRQERPADRQTGGNGPTRWHGVQSLSLHGSDTAALLKLAGELQQSGFVMSNLAYDVAPQTARSLEDELTSLALQRLRDRVQRIATDMGLELRNFRNLQIGNVTGAGTPIRPLQMMRAAAAAPAPPPAAEPGETTLEVAVSAEVVLLPRGTPP
ncbi:MAG TPA: SIMPL domain-containing protein [Alphaproteobacteria bacterium]